MANGDYGYFGKGDTLPWEAEGIPLALSCLRDPVTENLTRRCYHIAIENTNNIPMEDFNTLTATCMVCG